jgi:hypothetical protein
MLMGNIYIYTSLNKLNGVTKQPQEGEGGIVGSPIKG